MSQMYNRLRSTRRRALAKRQTAILGKLLDALEPEVRDFYDEIEKEYPSLRAPFRAYIRDLNHLRGLGAIRVRKDGENYYIAARLEWPTEITETEFFRQIRTLPKAKTTLIASN